MPGYSFEDEPKQSKGYSFEDDAPAPKKSLLQRGDDAVSSFTNKLARNFHVGGASAFGKIGATLLYPVDAAMDAIKGDREQNIESTITGKKPLTRNQERRQSIEDFVGELGGDKDSMAYGAGGLAVNLAATGGIGGLIKKAGFTAAPTLLANSPRAAQVLEAVATSGMRTGAPVAANFAGKAADMGIRSLGGAITGGASAALVDPEHAGTSAAIGGALPLGLAGLGSGARYLGGVAGSLLQPLTKAGQEKIAGRIISDFGQGGPMVADTRELVKGSAPTLAEATGNAGIARLQNSMRDVRPNSFVAREKANAAARGAAFDDIAGDAGKLDFFRADRSAVGKQLYDEALSVVPPPPTPYIKGQITQLLKRPSINEASRKAQQFALERGDKPYMNGSMQGLHDTKTALDDMISEAVRAGQGGHAKALQATQAKLVDVMEKMSPAYEDARTTYAAMSKPVNEMEALQGLKLTDAKGNITLSKVQNAIGNLDMRRGAAGTDAAKSIDAEKMKALYAIRDDLLRADNLASGKSAGSNTFQNIATDNILSSALPGRLGTMAKGKVGGVFGQVGQLLYSKPNEAIRNNLADFMLDPAAAQRAVNAANAPAIPTNSLLEQLLRDERARQAVYTSTPLLGRN